MTTIAHKPSTPDEERLGLIEQLESLRGEIAAGHIDAALEWIEAAIEYLRRQITQPTEDLMTKLNNDTTLAAISADGRFCVWIQL